MSESKNMKVARDAIAAWNARKIEDFAELLAEDCLWECSPFPEVIRGRERVLEAMQIRIRTFPDLQFEIIDLIDMADDVAIRWRATGTQRQEFIGIGPTNLKTEFRGCSINKCSNGKITHAWIYWDTSELTRLTVFGFRRQEENIRKVLNTVKAVVSEFRPEQSIERFLKDIARIIRENFGFSHVAIFAADEANRVLTKEAQHSKYADAVPLRIRQGFSEGLIGYCAETRNGFFVNDLQADPLTLVGVGHEDKLPRSRYLARIPATESELCCPILVQKSLRGVLNIEEERRGEFREGILDAMMTVCEHIGNAIEYAEAVRQYTGIQREAHLQEERLNLLLATIEELNAGDTSVGDVVDRILERLRRETGSQALLVYDVRKAAESFLDRREKDWGIAVRAAKRSFQLPSDERNLLVRAVREGVSTCGLTPDPAVTQLVGTDMGSFILAPMRHTGETRGVLILVGVSRANSNDVLEELRRTAHAVGNLLATLVLLRQV